MTVKLTTAPIDSFETLGRLAASDPEQMVFVSTAMAHGVPLIELDPAGTASASRLEENGVASAIEEGFEAFCHFAAPRWEELKGLSSELLRTTLRLKPVNSHPLLRLLRNHWFWLWYETFKTILASRALESGSVRITYWESPPLLIGGKLLYGGEDGNDLLLGPTLISPPEAGDDTADEALGKLLAAIEAAWSKVPEGERPPTLQHRSGGRFSLYSSALLSSVTAARPRVGWEQIESIASQIEPQLVQLKAVAAEHLKLGSYSTVSRLAALVTAFRPDGPETFTYPFKVETPSDEPNSTAPFENVPITLRCGPDEASNAAVHEASMARGGRIHSAWRTYIHDSNTLLGSWMNHSLWERIAQARDRDDWGILGRRITRFLANVFIANECSLYRVDYSQRPPALRQIGAFSDDEGGAEKMELIGAFMASDKVNRDRSICYRAMAQNRLEHVQYESPDTPPDKRKLDFPESERWSLRGRSAVALPIRVNGMVWGIAELISFNFDHFPFNVRAQLGDIVDTIGNALSFQSVSEMLNHVDRTIADHSLALVPKREKIVATLPAYFMSSDVMLVRFRTRRESHSERSGGGSHAEFSLVASVGNDPMFASSPDDLVHLLTPRFESMIELQTQVLDNVPSQKQPLASAAERERTVIVLLPSPRGELPAGAVVLRIPRTIRPEAGWHQPLQVLGQYLLNAIDTLDSEINWASNQRVQYGHEMIRSINTIADVGSRLRLLVRPMLERVQKDPALATLLSDLDRATRSLRLYSEALTDASLTSNDLEDPRIQAMRLHLDKAIERDPPPLDIRETFHAAIYSRRSEARDARVSFAPFPQFHYPKVRIDDVLLYDVVSTLVDNAIKYSAPGQTVQLVPRVDASFQVALSNLGAELPGNEQSRIFQDQFRGSFAQTHLPEGGRGLGLGYARALMEMAGGDLTYAQRRTEKREGRIGSYELVWHHFTITFSRRSHQYGR